MDQSSRWMEKSKTRICIPVCVRTISEIQPAIRRAAELAEIIELRLDCLTEFEVSDLPKLAGVTSETSTPLILTFRPSHQGGHREINLNERLDFWRNCSLVFRKELFDIELDLLTNESAVGLGLDWQRVICSHHDFSGVPADLERIFDAMSSTKARFLKIAVSANDTVDCLPIFALLERGLNAGREMIPLAMGMPGLATRVLGPSRGAYLTYAAMDFHSSTAPGQIEAGRLRDVYHLTSISRETQIMGLVGSPVSHSISPHVQNAAYVSSGLDAVYIPFDVQDLRSFIKRMAHPRTRELDWNLRGLSVTAPHKTAVIELLDSIDSAAAEIGAVNTIVVSDEGLRGYNTDAVAVLKAVAEVIGSLQDARVAVIGAGGVAKATLWSLKEAGADATLFARNEEQGRSLAASFGVAFEYFNGNSFGDFDVVINATPLGTRGSLVDETPALAEQLRGTRLAYDLVYNPVETKFQREAQAAGCMTIGGMSMLVLQGVEQFKLWTGREAPGELMMETARKALGR
jgi:3-dehydroquinate dehydratase/shikimate dehydrogenase